MQEEYSMCALMGRTISSRINMPELHKGYLLLTDRDFRWEEPKDMRMCEGCKQSYEESVKGFHVHVGYGL